VDTPRLRGGFKVDTILKNGVFIKRYMGQNHKILGRQKGVLRYLSGLQTTRVQFSRTTLGPITAAASRCDAKPARIDCAPAPHRSLCRSGLSLRSGALSSITTRTARGPTVVRFNAGKMRSASGLIISKKLALSVM